MLYLCQKLNQLVMNKNQLDEFKFLLLQVVVVCFFLVMLFFIGVFLNFIKL